jgi:hypothetical protein
MTGDDFLLFMEHFIKHTRVTKERPVLLLLDIHQSHFAVKVLHLAKENGVVLLSFPPHTSNKLKPLDRSMYGPFKKFVNNASDAWLRSNPNDNLRHPIHSKPLAAKCTHQRTSSLDLGIWRFNRDMFTDEDFLPSVVSDRPLQDTQNLTRTQNVTFQTHI